MTQVLQADTLVKVVIGPVVAVGDGFTPVTTLSLSTADEAEIMKHDAAAVTDISGNTFAAITSADGYYNLTITAAQLDTEGMLTVLVNDDSLCLPVKATYMVVNENVYDSLYNTVGTDLLSVSTDALGGVIQSLTDLKDFADAGYDPATNKVQGVVLVDTTTTNTDMVGTDNAALASVATESRLAELDEANLPTDIAAIPTTAMRGTDSAALASVATEARLAELDAANLPTDVAGIQSDTDDIQTRIPAALISGKMDSDVEAINDNTASAVNLRFSASTLLRGAAVTGTLSTTVMTSDVTEATDDHFIGRILIWTSGVLKDQASDITDYSGTNGTFTYTAVTDAPANTDTFVVV